MKINERTIMASGPTWRVVFETETKYGDNPVLKTELTSKDVEFAQRQIAKLELSEEFNGRWTWPE